LKFDENNSRQFGILSGEAAEKVQNFYRVADGLMRRIEEEAESEPFRFGSDLDPRSALSPDRRGTRWAYERLLQGLTDSYGEDLPNELADAFFGADAAHDLFGVNPYGHPSSRFNHIQWALCYLVVLRPPEDLAWRAEAHARRALSISQPGSDWRLYPTAEAAIETVLFAPHNRESVALAERVTMGELRPGGGFSLSSKCLRVMHEHGRLDYDAFSRFISAYSTILKDFPLRPPRWAADRPELSEEDRSFWWALHDYANRYMDEVISAPDAVSAVDVENLGFVDELGSGDERRLLAAVVLRRRYLRGDLEAESVRLGRRYFKTGAERAARLLARAAHPGGRVMGDRREAMELQARRLRAAAVPSATSRDEKPPPKPPIPPVLARLGYRHDTERPSGENLRDAVLMDVLAWTATQDLSGQELVAETGAPFAWELLCEALGGPWPRRAPLMRLAALTAGLDSSWEWSMTMTVEPEDDSLTNSRDHTSGVVDPREVRRASALAAEEMVGEDASASPGALRELGAVEHLFTRRNLPVARAFLLLRACLGKAPPDFEEMLELRNQLYWKLYGLLPFSGKAELNRRYERILNFERGSGQFGKLRRGNERAATAVALKNLSLNAGLSDADALRAFLRAG